MTLDPAKLRPDFPILAVRSSGGKPLVYLDNAATTQRPRQVIQAMVDAYEGTYANVHRGIHWLSEQTTDDYENAREKVRRFIHAESRDEVIFTHGTTEGINLVARSWGDANLRSGDEILLTIAEHHSNLVPWQQLAERTGAAVRLRRSMTTANCNWRRSTNCSARGRSWSRSRRCRMSWGRSCRWR